jgi:hypothetical protein
LTEKEFTAKWINKISDKGIKKFPDEFLAVSETEEFRLPSKALVIGEELFGIIEILTVDGSVFTQVNNYEKAKYIIYANRNKPDSILIPSDKNELKSVLASYGKYLDSIIIEIEEDYRKEFPLAKNSHQVVNEIFRILNLVKY